MAEPRPRVSVVIPTQDRLPWLIEAMRSVDIQREVTRELIVVDDASSDGTWQHLCALREPNVRIVRNDVAQQCSLARNRGLTLARGEFVMFLDDDDWLWPGALATLVAALDAEPRAVAAVGARRDWFVVESYQRRDVHPRRPMTRWIMDDLMFGWSAVSGQNLYRSDAVRAIDGYRDIGLAQDRDLWYRLAGRGPVVLRPETVMTYRVHKAQRSPPDIRARRERIARAAIRRLPRPARRPALRIRRATWLFDEAQEAFTRGRLVHGLTCAVRSVITAPQIVASPLVRPLFFWRLVGRLWHRLRGR